MQTLEDEGFLLNGAQSPCAVDVLVVGSGAVKVGLAGVPGYPKSGVVDLFVLKVDLVVVRRQH